MTLSLAELRHILDTKAGIFDTPVLAPDSKIIPLSALEQEFIVERDRIRNLTRQNLVPGDETVTDTKLANIKTISFDIDLLPIEPLKTSIDALKADLRERAEMTHVAIYYGLTAANQMTLIMQGVRLDSAAEDAPLDKPPVFASRKQFSTTSQKPTPASNIAIRNRFKNTFKFIHGKEKFVWGTYIRVNALLEKLEVFNQENCTHLQITFAYLNPDPTALLADQLDLRCFHLVFRGRKADKITTSTNVFSTYDHEQGYSGPKPSCPPFGETEE